MVLFGGAAHWARIAIMDTIAFIAPIQMRINLNQGNVRQAIKPPNHRVGNTIITTNAYWHNAALNSKANGIFGGVVMLLNVPTFKRNIAAIDNREIIHTDSALNIGIKRLPIKQNSRACRTQRSGGGRLVIGKLIGKIGFSMRNAKDNRLGLQILPIGNDRKIHKAVCSGRVGFRSFDRHDDVILYPRKWFGDGKT